jgi:hypothetical protein
LVSSGNATSDFQVDWVQVYQAIPQATPWFHEEFMGQ